MFREVSLHEGPGIAIREQARDSSACRAARRRWRGRRAIAGFAVAAFAIAGFTGCDKPRDRGNEAAIAAAIEKAQREVQEADRQMRERAAQDELARRQAEQAEIDARTGREDQRKAIAARFEERLRGALVEPASMQIRNQRLTPDGTALCAEFSAKNKQGVYVGFRRVVVSDTVFSFDHDPDDNYREPPLRFAALAKVTGCY